jgi:hypothetical protein
MRYCFVAVLTIICFKSFGQDFLGYDVPLYKDQVVTVKELPEKDRETGYYGFLKKANVSSVPYQRLKAAYGHSDYNTLVNKKFTVTNVIKDNSSSGFWFLELSNDETGTIFYEYNTSWAHLFILKLDSSYKIPGHYIDSTIDSSYDKFKSATTFHSPLSNEVVLYKTIATDTIYTAVFTTAVKEEYNPGDGGLIILFKNGDKITDLNARVESSQGEWDKYTGHFNFTYYCQIVLNSNQMYQLLNNELSDFRIGGHDVHVYFPQKYNAYLRHLLAKGK